MELSITFEKFSLIMARVCWDALFVISNVLSRILMKSKTDIIEVGIMSNRIESSNRRF